MPPCDIFCGSIVEKKKENKKTKHLNYIQKNNDSKFKYLYAKFQAKANENSQVINHSKGDL